MVLQRLGRVVVVAVMSPTGVFQVSLPVLSFISFDVAAVPDPAGPVAGQTAPARRAGHAGGTLVSRLMDLLRDDLTEDW